MKKSVGYLIVFVALVMSFVLDNWLAKSLVFVRADWLTYFFKFFTDIGTMVGLVIIGLFILFLAFKKKEYILPLIYATVATFLIGYMFKNIFLRPRPYEVLEIVPLVSHFASASFPSLHAALVFSLLPILNKVWWKFRYVWILVVSLIALSRVYLGVHYLSDVIMGALLGYVVAEFVLDSMKNGLLGRFNL